MRRIAIIGGGAAGTGAAWRLHQRLGGAVEITVYERAEHVGGRAWDLTFGGCHMEVGGVLLHSTGRITGEMMAVTGCREAVPSLSIDGKDETYAFWTDKGFPVLTRTTLASMAFGILKHVGPLSALRVTNQAKAMAKRYEAVYQRLAEPKPFATPDELFASLGLLEPTKVSAREHLRRLKVNDKMALDIVEAITHNMYNQGLEMNALACLVGLAGAGLAGGHLFVVEGGNWTLFDKTLKQAGIAVRANTKVTRVVATSTATATDIPDTTDTPAATDTTDTTTPAADLPFSYRLEADGVPAADFDAIVLAAPPALADLTIELDGRPLAVTAHPYQPVQTTLVVGELDPAYFGRPAGQPMPSTIFTAASAGAPFKSIGTTGFSPDHNSRIYKIFSADHVMTDSELDAIFSTIHAVHTHRWRGAYPVLTPATAHLPFELNPGLYFANALETIAGSIEVEAVSGTNAANLCANYLS